MLVEHGFFDEADVADDISARAGRHCTRSSGDWSQPVRRRFGLPLERLDGRLLRQRSDLAGRGYAILHPPRTEPWGQTIARILSPEGAIVGISYAPSLHDDAPSD